jgi:hypothetical protein
MREMIDVYIKDLSNNKAFNSFRKNIFATKENNNMNDYKADTGTKYINTVIKDNLSPTMYAYYFCEKSNRILSDKKASALKIYDFDLVDEDSNLKFRKDCEVVIHIKFINLKINKFRNRTTRIILTVTLLYTRHLLLTKKN